MNIRPSAAIRQNYNEIADLCRKTEEPIFLTKNGEGDLVVMDIETFNRREKMLRLREELLSVEEDRLAGRTGCTLDELDSYLDDMIDVFSKDGCEMVDILFDKFLKKYYADIDVSDERMTINLTDEEGHVLSFNLSQSEVHYVLHMVERRLNSFMRDDGGGGFGDED